MCNTCLSCNAPPTLTATLALPSPQVSASRKGLRNQLKSLLFRKGGPLAGLDEAPPVPNAPPPGTYPHTTIEAQMRQLSDLCMMLGDYETASSTLRMLASDFKADKAFRHQGGVSEALAAAAVLTGAPPAEVIAHYKEAFYRYSQASS